MTRRSALAAAVPGLLAAALALAACDSPEGGIEFPDDDTAGPGDDDSAPPDDDSAPPDDDTGPADDDTPPDPDPVEDLGSPEDPESWVFGLDRLHEVSITLPADSETALWADPYSYVHAGITFDGYELPDIGLRLKGKIGSFRDLSGKAGFRLKFGEYVPEGNLFGLETLYLNNMVVDYSFVKEHLGWMVFRAAGIPGCRTGYAWVTVNGLPYGLYLVLEAQTDEWLERWYADPTGNLYDGKYEWRGGWDYTLIDFTQDVQDLFELEEGEDVGHEDVHAVTEALDLYGRRPAFYTGVGAVVDLPRHQVHAAVEQWIGHLDGYSLNKNNYRVYFDPGDGLAELIPWDLDYAFQEDWAWGMNWTYPSGRISSLCMADATCRAGWQDAADAVCDIADSLDLEGEIEAVYELVWDAILADPRKEAGTGTVISWGQSMRDWVVNRSDSVRDFWDL